MYQLNQAANRSGTSFRRDVIVAPAALVRAFGQPAESDGYKVSGEFTFEGDGEVFTVYEYKTTSLYDPSQQTPETFWASEDLFAFHIGSRDGDVDSFAEWLEDRVASGDREADVTRAIHDALREFPNVVVTTEGFEKRRVTALRVITAYDGHRIEATLDVGPAFPYVAYISPDGRCEWDGR